ncbi:hypothetical protein AIOGIFDO_00727 [Candidatus Methanoperedenaceae archaeon GB37]|nr:hypothetical protein AIOGIFDO_00727 [Candidatus Methanoperedenaceae archaeon GB37]
MEFEAACRDVIAGILSGRITTQRELLLAKKRIARECGIETIPSNADILAISMDDERERVLPLLQKKPVRTISGVAVVAVMTSPAPCPHGRCVPCPGGPDSPFRSPQSYMGREPAALRAIANEYHPYRQVASRIDQLQAIGHPIEKVELIIMGGTFTARDPSYQEWFVKECLAAMNDAGDTSRRNSMHDLSWVQRANEVARVRNVGITVETRPDYSMKEHINRILRLGATRVELGVQSIDDAVLRRINRGHTVADTIEANALLRDSSLKVGFHMMPGLPGSTIKSDLDAFRELFKNPSFKPDYLKIYPTLVTEGTELEELWRRGEYRPIGDEEGVELIAEIKSLLPPYVRLQRVQRDIPRDQILAGIKKSHIRELAAKRLAERGAHCRCIRCREAGHQYLQGIQPEDITDQIHTYRACEGVEHFISFEDTAREILIGFARLRFPNTPYRSELQNAALVRELHVYGRLVPLGRTPSHDSWQHHGYGERLLRIAEEMALDAGYEKIAVISGIGAREYYRKLGYVREGPYMSKKLLTP